MKKELATHKLNKAIKTLIEEAKVKVTRSVNSIIVNTYFEIGKRILEDEQQGQHRATYAENTLAQLSKSLTDEFGSGYSVTNLEYMRKFYQLYKHLISQPLAGKSIKRIPHPVVEELGISL